MTVFNPKAAAADQLDSQVEAYEFFNRVIPHVPDQFEGETFECDDPEDFNPFNEEDFDMLNDGECDCGQFLDREGFCPVCDTDPFGDDDFEDFEDFEDDGQPDEYTEWQDVYGGDDWDHGQYDHYDEY